MLVWNDIIFIVWIQWLMLGRDGDLLGWQPDACEVFEKIGMVSSVQMQMGEAGIARHFSVLRRHEAGEDIPATSRPRDVLLCLCAVVRRGLHEVQKRAVNGKQHVDPSQQ